LVFGQVVEEKKDGEEKPSEESIQEGSGK